MERAVYSKYFSIGSNGNLHLDGVDLVEVAREFGTPAYVMSDKNLRDNCRAFLSSMEREFGKDGCDVAYASKALCAGFLYRILLEEGMNADVVSGGELYTALHAGLPANRLHFHGNNKTDAELRYAVTEGISSIVVDDYAEIARLDAICAKLGKRVRVMLRIKPGVDAHTHEFISTGHHDSKFGFGIEDGEAMRAAQAAHEAGHLDFAGVHCHIGSQIFETEPFAAAADIMCKLLADIKQTLGIELPNLIMGGGFGIKYNEDDHPVAISEMIAFLGKAVRDAAAKHGLKVPVIGIEPGRSMAGEAGCTLYTVGGIKRLANARHYIAIDGGMPDNPRFALYDAKYEAILANKAEQPREELVTIAGKCCESGDLIVRDTMLQYAEAGDTVCVFATGAYNYSMASNYNRLTRPPIVLIRDGKAILAVRRESYEDLVRNEIL